jgi:3-oxoadipate enol-lactonase
MWDGQMPALTQSFRVVRYDRRGHGKSGVPAGPYTMEMLGRDALAVLDAANVHKTHWCGLSMGGMVGMWLGANAPERVDRLILSNTSAYFPDKEIWNGRIKTVQEKGLQAVVQGTLERWFTAGFREREPQKVKGIADMFLATKPEGYIACGQAVAQVTNTQDGADVTLADGPVRRFDRVVVTIPCPRGAALCRQLTDAERERRGRLVYQGTL